MDKKERIQAVLDGLAPDRTPVGMWYHFGDKYTAREAAKLHYELYRKSDQDMIKIMYDAPYFLNETIESASDWRRIRPLGTESSSYRKQMEILKYLVDMAAGECPVWITMFGPFKLADMAAGDEMLMKHCKEDPESVHAGIEMIAQEQEEWARGYLENGADAIYYSAQFGEIGRFSKEEWEYLVKPFDLRILKVTDQIAGKYSILHLCGEPEYDFKVHIDWFADYPGAMVNWATYANEFSLEQGRTLFKRPILGGLDNRNLMVKGTEEEIGNKVQELIDLNGMAGYVVGADCSVMTDDFEGGNRRIKAAVDAAKAYSM